MCLGRRSSVDWSMVSALALKETQVCHRKQRIRNKMKFKTAQQMKVVYFKLFRPNFLETVACALVVGVLWSRNIDW